MGYTEAVYYMLNGGLGKYIIEKLEVTDTWKHDFIAPGYASQSTELCVGWDEVTVDIPTTASVTVNQNLVKYTPVAPSKGYKKVIVSIPVSESKTIQPEYFPRSYTFRDEGVEAYKTVTCSASIKAHDSRTENHTTWTYPNGGYVGVREVTVNVKMYDEDADEWKDKEEEIEEDCDPVIPYDPHDDEPVPYPIEGDVPPPIFIPMFPPHSKIICGKVAFEIHDEYAVPTYSYQNPYSVDVYTDRDTHEIQYFDMLIFVRWFIYDDDTEEWYISHDDLVSQWGAQDATTHGQNYRDHYPSASAGQGLYTHSKIVNSRFEVSNDGWTGTVYLDILEEDWQQSWGGTWQWQGPDESTGRTEADCTHLRTSALNSPYYIPGIQAVDWR